MGGSLEVDAHKTGKVYGFDIFTENLNNLFIEDAKKITMRIEGKVLTKWLSSEDGEKVAPPTNL